MLLPPPTFRWRVVTLAMAASLQWSYPGASEGWRSACFAIEDKGDGARTGRLCPLKPGVAVGVGVIQHHAWIVFESLCVSSPQFSFSFHYENIMFL